eukprot:3058649-Lingulodinium_polyedra.AAC.1
MLAQHAATGTPLPDQWKFASRPLLHLLDPVTWQPGQLTEHALVLPTPMGSLGVGVPGPELI